MSTNEPQHSSSSRRILSRNKPHVTSSATSHQEEESGAEKRTESSRLKLPIAPVATQQTKEIKPDPNASNADSNGILLQQQHQQHQQILMNQHNYLNKEPFNEEIEIEESSLFNPTEPSFNWRFLVFDRLKQIIEDMKKLQLSPTENKVAIKDHYRRAILLCSTIKKLNRISNMNINKARIRTHEEKNKIDEHHLELQNLLYEISHLKKEINTCLEFRSLDEDINLVSIEEFFANAPVEVSKPDLTKTDKHKLKLAQLDWELIQRQNMLMQIKDLENQIEQHERQLKLKQNKLESLHPKLNQIIDSCKPTLDYFNTNFDDTCVFSEPIQYLPRPLYQFYMMMGAFRDTIDNEIQIQINGDIEEAKRVNLNETVNILDDDDSDSGEDENEAEVYNKKKKSKSKANKKKTTNSEKIFQTYPLSCQVIFNVKGYGQLILELFYLHILKIITVKPEIKLSKDVNFSDNSMLRPETIFNCLFANDNGLESPNLSNKLIFSNFGIKSIEPFLKQIGIPYRWCQIICGLFYETKHDRMNMFYPQTTKSKQMKDDNKIGEKFSSNGKAKDQAVEKMDVYQENVRRNGAGQVEDEDDDDEADANENNKQENCLSETKLFERILSRLKARFKARIALQEIICQLKSLNMSSLENINLIDNQMRFKIQSTVAGFKEISFEKFSSYRDNEQFLENELIDENSCSFFELTLHNSNAQLVSHIAIHEDYPIIAPIFSIVINWKHERNFRNDESIRCMEQEINLYGDNYIIKDANANLCRSMSNSNKRLRKSISSGRMGAYDDGNYDIFAKQLSHLLVCFDLYLETESASLNNYEIPQVKLFPNSVRGRDRRKPFVYMMSKNLFVQRMQHDADC